MGKKAKVGKQRKDRFYQLAKETGYRARSAFKLIQLNRKYEFLQRSKVLVDLCAAPGGWLQVAERHMPVQSVIVGIDLVAIKPLGSNVHTIKADITTPECRSLISKQLQTWKADVFLNDGAPNLGKTWSHDAFSQTHLTLSALKLASEFLIKGGWFVTKLFRSKDYDSLIWLFGKLFKKVHVTKPLASRHESAEIFVVCEKYISPDKIDPRFFDANHLFAEVDDVSKKKMDKKQLLRSVQSTKKAPAVGYADDVKESQILRDVDFIQAANHLELLSGAYEIKITSEKVSSHRLTTPEILECCKDIKVLGRKDILSILDWRKKLKKELFPSEDEKNVVVENVDEDEAGPQESAEDAELSRMLKRKKKIVLKQRRKLNERLNLKMVHKGDQLVEEMDNELFQLDKLNTKNIDQIEDAEPEDEISDDEAKSPTGKKRKVLFEKQFEYEQNDDDDEEEHSENESVESESTVDLNADDDEAIDGSDEKEDDGLMVKFKDLRNNKSNMVFERSIFSKMDDDGEELDFTEIKAAEEPRSRKKLKKTDVKNDDDEEESEDEATYKAAATPRVKLDAQGLALAEDMIVSEKAKRDIVDASWNRWVRGPEDNLPRWFREDEAMHSKPGVDPSSEAAVEHYKSRSRAINVRPIKKVAEAKGRKMRRMQRRMEKAKKTAESITNTDGISESEKMSSLKSLYKKTGKVNAAKKERKLAYVVSKKGKSTSGRPAGVKGRYKRVDSRMRKDKSATERAQNKSGAKKMRSKKTGPKKGGKNFTKKSRK